MADPICRWRNATVKQVCEFNQILPNIKMERNEARSLVEKRWQLWDNSTRDFFRTPYQLAAQLGLYYEDNDFFYVRFEKCLSFDEALKYLYEWGHKYYVPNPYSTSLKIEEMGIDSPIIINNYLVNWIADKGEGKWIDAKQDLFHGSIGNDDILQNMLNNYSDVEIVDGMVKLKANALHVKYDNVFADADPTDKKAFFEYFGGIVSDDTHHNYQTERACQIIYYGAPGTGKSHAINEITNNESVVRTTFHPDSDYSTFVGAYKPTTIEVRMRDMAGHVIKESGKDVTENRIIYEFVEQAFLQAYIQAWKFYAEAKNNSDAKKQFLVIEEINRGNCAQIFGDLFQLLDRNEQGFSDYPIQADNDMRKQLSKAFTNLTIPQQDKINTIYGDATIANKILHGEILLLPNNLYIWATMNTSDQSLFPIDSAFKRRWDWQYMPMCKGRDQQGNELNWRICADTCDYDWWSFLCKINEQIESITNSEDKKLGFFFCKAIDSIIGAETFVGKVLFYLWNDVFKDFGFDNNIFKDTDSTSTLSYNRFYDTDNKGNAVVRKDKVQLFLDKIGVEKVQRNDIGDEDIEDEDNDGKVSTSSKDITKYKINGEGSYPKKEVSTELIRKYIENNPTLTADQVVENWKSLGNLVSHFIETQEEYNARQDSEKSKRSNAVQCGSSQIYVAWNGWGTKEKMDELKKAIESKDWGLTIEEA
jgi:hypothetical protein